MECVQGTADAKGRGEETSMKVMKMCASNVPKQKGGSGGGESLTIKRGTSGVSWGIQGNIHRAADGDPPLRDAHISCTV